MEMKFCQSCGMPLGFDAKYQFEEQSCEMADGEMLVLYTDGVTEARNSQREMMGMDRWVEMVMRGGDLLKAVQEYMGQAEPIDDITLMTICKKEFIGPK
jgi:serine phosphatase RsbU (regulator of sigma subunit)